MEKFINTLEAEWCDSKEALAVLTPADYQKLQIPNGLASLIMEAVVDKRSKQEKMDIESPIEDYLYSLSQKYSADVFADLVSILTKIFTNVRENLIDEKYRTLKKTNNKISLLAEVKEIVQILKHGGFEEVHPGFVLRKINIATIDECLDSLNKFAPKIKFNPYQ